jgi:regulatory protein
MPVRREPGQRRTKPLDALADVPMGARLRVRPSGKATGRVSLVVDGRSIGTLTTAAADALSLHDGPEWSPRLALVVARAFEEDEALVAASRLLDVRARSKGELADRLRQKRVKPEIAQKLIADLERAGTLNDAAFARAYAKAAARKPSGARLIESKLRAKHVDGDLAKRAAKTALEGRDLLADATLLAQKRARALPPKLDAAARSRRLLGLLARRGFDGEICRQAVRRALGPQADEAHAD